MNFKITELRADFAVEVTGLDLSHQLSVEDFCAIREAWFKAGVTCVGMGSNLMAKNTNGKFNYKKIESLTRDALKIIKDLKK